MVTELAASPKATSARIHDKRRNRRLRVRRIVAGRVGIAQDETFLLSGVEQL
jgi:hypothetical protein